MRKEAMAGVREEDMDTAGNGTTADDKAAAGAAGGEAAAAETAGDGAGRDGLVGGEASPVRVCGAAGGAERGQVHATNNFVGSKVSIVSPKAQTTRTTVKGIGIWGNTQIIFLDTPGIFKPKRRLDRAMVASAWGGVGDADITALVVDAKRGFDDETRAIIARLKENKIPAVLVLNKIDLVSGETLLQLCAALNDAYAFAETFMVSALNGKRRG